MTRATIVPILLIALAALAFVLWPLLRRGKAPAGLLPVAPDRRDELDEEKSALYRAIRELEFDYHAGHLSEDDFAELRSRYEARAAQVLKELDALEASRPRREEPSPARGTVPAASAPARQRAWTRHPLSLVGGAVALVVFGISLGLGVARFTEPDRTVVPPGSRLPVPMDMPGMGAAETGRPIPPEMLRGMLEAAHQSLDGGRYQEAIAAYQAVLKRDPRNVDAITHLGVILAVAGHTDPALEAFDKAIAIDSGYAHAWWDKARLLSEAKQDDAGAIRAWEKFVALVPSGEDRDRALRLIQEAKARLVKPGR